MSNKQTPPAEAKLPLISLQEPEGAPQPPATRLPQTLADAVELYQDAVSEHPARVKIRSAFRTVAVVLGRPLAEISSSVEVLRPLMATANPALVGVKPRQWRDVRYITKRGLRDLGVEVFNDRDTTQLSPAWASLIEASADRRVQIGLTKFLRFCTRTDVSPALINPGHFNTFLEELETKSLNVDPRAVYRQTVRLWNQAASGDSSWPQLILPAETDGRRFALPIETFPESFRNDMERFLTAGEIGDELDDGYAPRVRAITTRGRRQMLHRLASALVLSGVPAAEIENLRVLCQLEHARTAMRYFRERHPENTVTEGMLNHVWLLRGIAKSWLGDALLDDALKQEIIRKYDRAVKAARSGIRQKNRLKLRQFDLAGNLAALVDLPQKTCRRVSRMKEPGHNDSVQLMYALMIAILIYAPIRSKNLVELCFTHNLSIIGAGKARVLRLQLAPGMTKTRRAYEAPLPKDILPLYDLWLRKHRPQFCSKPNDYLFPNPRGELRNRNGLANQLMRFIERETGLKMNVHLFRHLAVKVILENDPNHMEVARQVLGHASRRTTERAYADFRGDSSFRAYSAALDECHAPDGGKGHPSGRR